ncbi:MAG: hypothetical protein K8S55_02440 [Phycisphaerae bacterium]|nr:hypothetical protein [Phycisphaerae bacterium]
MAEKRKRKWKKWLVILLLLLGGLAYLHFPTGPVKIIISKETTVVDKPVNPDGTINYIEAINEQFAKGVTPENNAAPLLLKAFGVSILPDETREEILHRLGLTAVDIDSDHHFVPWYEREKIDKLAKSRAAAGRGKLKISESDKKAHLEDVRQMLRKGRVHPELQSWLDANAEALRLVEKATTRPRYYMPIVSKSNPPSMIDVLLINISRYRPVAKALVTRAMLKLHKGDVDGAWQDILTAHRFARLVQHGPFLIQPLVAISIESRAAKNGIVLATSGQLTPQKAKSMLQDIATLQPVVNIVDTMNCSERLVALDTIMRLSRGQAIKYFEPYNDNSSLLSSAIKKLRGPTVVQKRRWLMGPNGDWREISFSNLDWNEMLRIMNSWYDRMVKSSRLPRFQGRAEAQKAFDADIYKLRPMADQVSTARWLLLKLGGRPCRTARSREIAHSMVAMYLPSVSRVFDNQDYAKIGLEVEKTAIALAWFHGEKGRWPTGLGELVPKYLPAVPADCFSQNPLVYRPTKQGYILYSVGINQRDDGGVDNGAGGKDDIVAEVK